MSFERKFIRKILNLSFENANLSFERFMQFLEKIKKEFGDQTAFSKREIAEIKRRIHLPDILKNPRNPLDNLKNINDNADRNPLKPGKTDILSDLQKKRSNANWKILLRNIRKNQ